MITPIVCTLSVNSFLIYSHYSSYIAKLFNIADIAHYGAWAGVVGMVAIYASKYTFFDTTKEMALIPLADNDRANGKAAVDGLGGRLGKSSYGAIHTVVCSLTGYDHMSDICGYLLQITVVLSVVWLWVMYKLSLSYNNAVQSQNANVDIPHLTMETPEKTTEASPATAV